MTFTTHIKDMKGVRYTGESSNSKNICVTSIQETESTMSGKKSQHHIKHVYKCINFSIPFHRTIINCMVDHHIINLCIPSGMRSLKGIIKRFSVACIIFLFILFVPPSRSLLVNIVILIVVALKT